MIALNKKGVWGKYYQAYRQRHTVRVYKDDGQVTVHYFTLEDGAVMLEPDIRKYFPTSECVNEVLQTLISLRPTQEAG